MKKEYLIPEFNIIALDLNDIIAHSIATSLGDDIVDASDSAYSNWWADGEYIYTPWGEKF